MFLFGFFHFIVDILEGVSPFTYASIGLGLTMGLSVIGASWFKHFSSFHIIYSSKIIKEGKKNYISFAIHFLLHKMK